MTKADAIRALAAEGHSVSAIATQLGIRYQHAYNVLKRSGPPAELKTDLQVAEAAALAEAKGKPPLLAPTLLAGGFVHSGRWILSLGGALQLDTALPKLPGVYGFGKSDVIQYVGVATMGLAKRLYFYAKPGKTQRTSLRINAVLREELASAAFIDIYTATPPDLTWNGLPVHGAAGLELGLIKAHALPWNMRGAK